MYSVGYGVSQNKKKSRVLYKRACDGGYSESCYNLGFIYDNGIGVRQNKSIAKEMFGKACDGGYNSGCKDYAKLNKQVY